MTAEETAQWVIDNRYPKSELQKISDHEMYNFVKEELEDRDIQLQSLRFINRMQEKELQELKKVINTRTFNIVHEQPKLPTGGGML